MFASDLSVVERVSSEEMFGKMTSTDEESSGLLEVRLLVSLGSRSSGIVVFVGVDVLGALELLLIFCVLMICSLSLSNRIKDPELITDAFRADFTSSSLLNSCVKHITTSVVNVN